jgi:hypothetical protein
LAQISVALKRLGFRVQNPVDIKCCHRNKIFQRSKGILFTFGEIVFGSEGIILGHGGIILGHGGIVSGFGEILLGHGGIGSSSE